MSSPHLGVPIFHPGTVVDPFPGYARRTASVHFDLHTSTAELKLGIRTFYVPTMDYHPSPLLDLEHPLNLKTLQRAHPDYPTMKQVNILCPYCNKSVETGTGCRMMPCKHSCIHRDCVHAFAIYCPRRCKASCPRCGSWSTLEFVGEPQKPNK